MNERLSNLIPDAMRAIREQIANEDGKVTKEYKGYLNGLGPGLLQAGLIPTLAFCTDLSKTKDDTDKNNVLNALHTMMDKDNEAPHLMAYIVGKCLRDAEDYERATRITNASLDRERVIAMEEQVMEYALALKLALKSFHLVEKPQTSGS